MFEGMRFDQGESKEQKERCLEAKLGKPTVVTYQPMSGEYAVQIEDPPGVWTQYNTSGIRVLNMKGEVIEGSEISKAIFECLLEHRTQVVSKGGRRRQKIRSKTLRRRRRRVMTRKRIIKNK